MCQFLQQTLQANFCTSSRRDLSFAVFSLYRHWNCVRGICLLWTPLVFIRVQFLILSQLACSSLWLTFEAVGLVGSWPAPTTFSQTKLAHATLSKREVVHILKNYSKSSRFGPKTTACPYGTSSRTKRVASGFSAISVYSMDNILLLRRSPRAVRGWPTRFRLTATRTCR